MDNVNKIINRVIIPALLFSFFIYLLYDWNSQQGGDWRSRFTSHKQVQIEGKAVNGLMLGGSNVAYSLSAEIMSQNTEEAWFNFGLSNEGFSDENYWNYIRQSLSDVQKEKTAFIIYSSMSSLRFGYIEGRKNELSNIFGERSLNHIPNMTLAHRITRRFNKETESARAYPLSLPKGDMDFTQKYCPSPDSIKISLSPETDLPEIENWAERQILEMKSIFPNAEIFFTVPSVYYNPSEDIISYENVLVALENAASKFSDDINRVVIVKERAFPGKDYLCDAMHHGNDRGREWRTQNLHDQIKPYLAKTRTP